MPQNSTVVVAVVQFLIAALVGAATAYQPGINARFSAHAGDRIHGGVVSFAVGLAAMILIALAMRSPVPSVERLSQAPWWAWTGGLCGAFFVTASLLLVPKMGSANLVAGIIAGQMIGSMVIDHFGHVGLAVHPFGWGRAVGIVLILAGVACVRWL